MISLHTFEQFKLAKSKDMLPLQCKYCKNTFYLTKKQIHNCLNIKAKQPSDFCSLKCYSDFKCKLIQTNCTQCNKNIIKRPSQLKHKSRKTNNFFCSRSCAAIYNNTHKTKGTRVSKLEIWLQEQLAILYPNLEIHYNRKDSINSELDIYIPSFNLAFELNGIFHYEPIYGKDKLDQIQNNDNRKFAACIENNISLCIIDTSKLTYFKPTNAQKYLDIITSIISKNKS